MAQDSTNSLQPQDLTLDLVATYVRAAGNVVWSGGLVRLLAELGFSDAAARIALGRLVRRGLLQREKRGRLVYYTLSPRLRSVLAEGDRRIFSFGLGDTWQGIWTVLWYSIPEQARVQRRRFSRRLRFLGFGSLQDGVWVATDDREADVAALIEELDVGEHVAMFVGRFSDALEVRTVVETAWDIDELAERYESYLSEFGRYRRAAERRRLSDRDAFVIRTRAVDAFRRFPSLDPGLPESLLGRPLKRREAVETFHELDRELADPATRYFASVMESDPGSTR